MKMNCNKSIVQNEILIILAFIVWGSSFSQNYFKYNGSADVLLRYEPRGGGGRAIVHGAGNTLVFNYGKDFTAGTRVDGRLSVRSLDNNWLRFNNGDIPSVSFIPNNGNSIFHIAHSLSNRLIISHGTNIGATSLLTIVNSGNVGIGTTNPDAKLAVKGKIHAQEVKLDLNGAAAPDYVFKENYDLKTLDEVRAHIDKEGHLPNVPSAKEMERNGINLKEMNLKLLEKIEELTLYILEQDKKIKTQDSFINRLKNNNQKLELIQKRLEGIEATINTKKHENK